MDAPPTKRRIHRDAPQPVVNTESPKPPSSTQTTILLGKFPADPTQRWESKPIQGQSDDSAMTALDYFIEDEAEQVVYNPTADEALADQEDTISNSVSSDATVNANPPSSNNSARIRPHSVSSNATVDVNPPLSDNSGRIRTRVTASVRICGTQQKRLYGIDTTVTTELQIAL